MNLFTARTVFTLLSLALPPMCHAHVAGTESAVLSLASVDPLVTGLLVLTALVYQRGRYVLQYRINSPSPAARKRPWYFWSGWITLFAALATPLDALGEHLFSAHMVQHELLMLVAAPLLVLSRPGSALLKGLPQWCGTTSGTLLRFHGIRRFWLAVTAPFTAWILHLVGLWGWHAPPLFQAGLENNGMHILQHSCFLFIALVFWWALLRSRTCRNNGWLGALYLFTTSLHAGLLGALLTFSSRLWYPFYLDTTAAWGLSALEDQQLGGLIMWMPAGVVFMVAAALVLVPVLKELKDGKDAHPALATPKHEEVV